MIYNQNSLVIYSYMLLWILLKFVLRKFLDNKFKIYGSRILSLIIPKLIRKINFYMYIVFRIF